MKISKKIKNLFKEITHWNSEFALNNVYCDYCKGTRALATHFDGVVHLCDAHYEISKVNSGVWDYVNGVWNDMEYGIFPPYQVLCSDCNGDGYLWEAPCRKCNGSGKRLTEKVYKKEFTFLRDNS